MFSGVPTTYRFIVLSLSAFVSIARVETFLIDKNTSGAGHRQSSGYNALVRGNKWKCRRVIRLEKDLQ
jgi:hypothetical protein